jgi:hypothetical protein
MRDTCKNEEANFLTLTLADPPDYKFRVFTSEQKRRMMPKIKRELCRRSAIEPAIGHLKSEHRMGRNYSGIAKAVQPTPASLPSATTSAASSAGCIQSLDRKRRRARSRFCY